MINTMTTMSQATSFVVPACVRDRFVSACVLPMTGDVSGRTAVTSIRGTGIQGTTVSGYRQTADAVAAVMGAFPGPSAWSPPI